MFGALPCVNVPGGCNTTTGLPNVLPDVFNANPDAIFTPDQLAFAKYRQINSQHSYERYVYGNVSGPIFALPGGDVRFSIGGEYRGEGLKFTPDALVVAGYAPNQSFPTDGHFSVKSAYAELFIPVIKEQPFFYQLDITPSARIDDYSNFGSAKTWKIGGNWAPVRDIRFRASYSTGFRAPEATELFGGTFLSDVTLHRAILAIRYSTADRTSARASSLPDRPARRLSPAAPRSPTSGTLRSTPTRKRSFRRWRAATPTFSLKSHAASRPAW